MNLSQSLDEIEAEIAGYKAAMEDVSRALAEASEQAQQVHDEWARAMESLSAMRGSPRQSAEL